MTMREKFERWITSQGERDLSRHHSPDPLWPSGYTVHSVQLAWRAWQAGVMAILKQESE